MFSNEQSTYNVNRELVGWALATPLHIANFMSYYYSNIGRYDAISIYINEYWNYNILSKRYIEFLKKSNITVKSTRGISDFEKTNNRTKSTDIVFVGKLNWKVLLKARSNVKNAIIIDEGLSSYRSLLSLNRSESKFKIPKYYTSALITNTILLLNRQKKLRFRMFESNSIRINEMYKKGLLKYFDRLDKFDPIYPNRTYEKSILYCSQPWVELGVMTEKEYVESLFKTQALVKSKGYDFVLKKHPAEKLIDYKKYGIFLLEDNHMLEEVFYRTPFKALISKNSTSSFLIPALFSVESYVLKISEIEGLGKHAEQLFRNYCYDFQDFI